MATAPPSCHPQATPGRLPTAGTTMTRVTEYPKAPDRRLPGSGPRELSSWAALPFCRVKTNENSGLGPGSATAGKAPDGKARRRLEWVREAGSAHTRGPPRPADTALRCTQAAAQRSTHRPLAILAETETNRYPVGSISHRLAGKHRGQRDRSSETAGGGRQTPNLRDSVGQRRQLLRQASCEREKHG